jgi:beta-N-acetylhexosaminidase
MEGTPPEPERPQPPTPAELVRRLRSRLPVSPLPWRWSRRLRRGALVALVVLVLGGAAASILLQGDTETTTTSSLPPNLPAPVKRALAAMSPVEKADAVLIAGFDDPGATVAELRHAQLGGVLVGAQNWPNASKGRALVSELRAAGSERRRIPPLIAVEQEGGSYRALADLPPSETELDIGLTLTPDEARTWALDSANSLRDHGFDLNLAPVADVATLDSAVSDRAFSDDPRVAAQMTAAAVRGCAQGKIACAVSHFPGLGAASQDTAAGPATVGLDQTALEERDLLPFKAAFGAGVPAVVLSLAFYAAYDPVVPAALSPTIANELLRDRLGFKGVAITDDLSSGAIAAGIGAPEAAQSALAAGADMVLVSDPLDAKRTRGALAEAVKDGGIPSERIDEAVARVLELKRKLGLLPGG